MKYPRTRIFFLLALLVLIGGGATLGFMALKHSYLSPKTASLQNVLASVFFAESTTVPQLLTEFNNAGFLGPKVKILIVAGHEPDSGGAEYRDLKERDMTLALATDLAKLLQNDNHFQVIMARDQNGWNPDLQKYFDTHWADIQAFAKTQKTEMASLIDDGKIVKITDGVPHANALPDAATRLFGINKWADENGISIMIHVHFNNYYRAHLSQPGAYRGFTIYVPDSQYSNAKVSRTLASNIFSRLFMFFPVSDAPGESLGIVGDQDLIAIGQSNTVDGASLLIEYGYIYQPEFATAASRETTFQKMAEQTYLGLQDFFAAKAK